jgi:hypothetical protein
LFAVYKTGNIVAVFLANSLNEKEIDTAVYNLTKVNTAIF